MTHWAERALASAVVVAALSACAGPLDPAPPKVYRVGYVSGSTQAETAPAIETFRQALRDLGYVEGKNVSLEIRWDEGFPNRVPGFAAELVALKVDVIVVRSVPEALALKEAVSAIPIVMLGVQEPVENGLVTSVARPGGNITGAASTPLAEIAPRRLQLLKEAVPAASRVAYFFDASNPAQVRGYEAARNVAPGLGIELQPLEVRSPGDFADAFASATRSHPDAISFGGGGLVSGQRSRILDFINTIRIPTMFPSAREWVDGGGLLFYDADPNESTLVAATYVARILKGKSLVTSRSRIRPSSRSSST